MTSSNYGFIPFHKDEITLKAAVEQVSGTTPNRDQAPLLVRLAHELAKQKDASGFLHHGLSIQQHESIHVLLGRGFLVMDEAFTTGFTIGCAKKTTTTSEKLYAQISTRIFPLLTELDAEAIAVFKDAVKLAYVSYCMPLDTFDFQQWMDQPVKKLRKIVGLEPELLRAYFEVEKRRYPNSAASQRLLPPDSRIAVY